MAEAVTASSTELSSSTGLGTAALADGRDNDRAPATNTAAGGTLTEQRNHSAAGTQLGGRRPLTVAGWSA